MATKEQWETYKYIHDEETARYRDLILRGQVYLTVATAYVAALAFKADYWISVTHCDAAATFFLGGTVVCFLLSLCVILGAISVLRYEGITDPEKIIEGYGETPPSNEDFFDDRIVDLTVATNRNSRKNDIRAICLSWATVLMVLGVLFQAALLVMLYQKG